MTAYNYFCKCNVWEDDGIITINPFFVVVVEEDVCAKNSEEECFKIIIPQYMAVPSLIIATAMCGRARYSVRVFVIVL